MNDAAQNVVRAVAVCIASKHSSKKTSMTA